MTPGMKRLLMVASLSVLVTAAVWASSKFYSCPGWPRRLYHNVVLGEDYAAPDVQFQSRMAGGGRSPEGNRISFREYRSSDCVDVTFEVEGLGSVAEAQEKMRKTVARASRVVERNNKLDLNQEPAGPRAVLMFTGKNDAAMIAWTSGKTLVTITSSSLPHALAYEKRCCEYIMPQADE